MFSKHRYTLFGVAAILLWSTLVALCRQVAEQFGAVGGAALIYTVASVMLFITIGSPRIRHLSWRYLIVGGGLFVAYEVFFSLALGYANDRHQAVEMSVINYLWPSLTVLFAIPASRNKVSWLIYPSLVMAFFGVVWSLVGDEQLSLSMLAYNISTNPLAYTLAFSGAVIWAVYCNVTKRLSDGKNAITLFFAFTALSLWVQYATTEQPDITFSFESAVTLLITSLAMGSGYALWNIAIIGGNMMFLATLSYFTPILSTLLSMVLLGIQLSVTFWQGVILVTLGSLLSWWATRKE